MHYMLILTADPDAWQHDRPTEGDGVIDDWMVYTQALHEAGVLVAGHGLQGDDTATTVQVRDGERVVTDGPFTETKEHLVGYYVIDAGHLDTALGWAAKAPNARVGSTEVRPVIEGSAVDQMLGA